MAEFKRENFITYDDIDLDRTDEDYLYLKDGRRYIIDEAKVYFFTDIQYQRAMETGQGTDKRPCILAPLNMEDRHDRYCFTSDDLDCCYSAIYDPYYNKPEAIGGNKMAENGSKDLFRTVMSMKMLEGMSSEKGDMDLGKLYLMQQLSSGEKLQLTDVMKSKLIGKLKLDEKGGSLPLDKMMLLQMLEEGSSIDMSQIIMMKMVEGMFKED